MSEKEVNLRTDTEQEEYRIRNKMLGSLSISAIKKDKVKVLDSSDIIDNFESIENES